MADEKTTSGWSRWRVTGWVAGLVVLGVGAVLGVGWGFGRPDWESFFPETRFFRAYKSVPDGALMFGYLPAVFLIFVPFTVWLGPMAGLVSYMVLNIGALAGSLWVVYRGWVKGWEGRYFFGWLVVLGSVPFAHVLKMNQLTIWVLFLCAAGLMLAGRGRDWWGGVILGLAGVIKVLPFALAGYLIFRRKWRGLAGMGLAVILFEVVPSILFLGWQGMITEHRAWFERGRMRSSRMQIEDPFLSGVYRYRGNFSYSSVLSRWLRARPAEIDTQIALMGKVPKEVVEKAKKELRPNEWLTLDPVPPPEGNWRKREPEALNKIPRFHAMNLSAEAVWWVWAVSLGGLMGGVGFWTWRSKAEDWSRAGSVWMLAMFFLTPFMMNYYLALGFPGVAVLYNDIVEGGSGRRRVLQLLGLAGWVLGVAVLGWRPVRWFGIHYVIFGIMMAGIMAGNEGKDKNVECPTSNFQ